MTSLQQGLTAPLAISGDSRAELLATYQDRLSMEQAAEMSGGAYHSKETFTAVIDQLKSIASGKVIRSSYAIWKSYWWFIPLVTVLGLEWFLRKRGGLL